IPQFPVHPLFGAIQFPELIQGGMRKGAGLFFLFGQAEAPCPLVDRGLLGLQRRLVRLFLPAGPGAGLLIGAPNLQKALGVILGAALGGFGGIGFPDGPQVTGGFQAQNFPQIHSSSSSSSSGSSNTSHWAQRSSSSRDRKSTRLNSSHASNSYAVFSLNNTTECGRV